MSYEAAERDFIDIFKWNYSWMKDQLGYYVILLGNKVALGYYVCMEGEVYIACIYCIGTGSLFSACFCKICPPHWQSCSKLNSLCLRNTHPFVFCFYFVSRLSFVSLNSHPVYAADGPLHCSGGLYEIKIVWLLQLSRLCLRGRRMWKLVDLVGRQPPH